MRIIRPAKKASDMPMMLFLLILIPLTLYIGARFFLWHKEADIAALVQKGSGLEITFTGGPDISLSAERGVITHFRFVSLSDPKDNTTIGTIDELEIGIDTHSFFSGMLIINDIVLRKADLLLDDRLSLAALCGQATSGAETKIKFVSLVDSRIQARNQTALIEKMTVFPEEQATKLIFSGQINGLPLAFSLEGDPLSKFSSAEWNFRAAVNLYSLSIATGGQIRNNGKTIDLPQIKLAGNGTDAGGNLLIQRDETANAYLTTGTLKGTALDLSSIPFWTETISNPDSPKRESFFSAKKLPFDWLKGNQAKINISLDTVTTGVAEAQNFLAQMTLENDRLVLSPISMLLGKSQAKAVALVDVSGEKPRFSVIVKAPQTNLSDLFKLGGFQFLLSGKGDFDLDLTAYGSSPHEMAANSYGVVDIVLANGMIDTTGLATAFSIAADSLIPGIGLLISPSVNCLASHVTINKGILHTSGTIFDMRPATFILAGNAHLGSEELAMQLYVREKSGLLNGAIPPLKIEGSLTALHANLETKDVFRRAASALMENTGIASLFGMGSFHSNASGSFSAMAVENGQNACAYTLDSSYRKSSSFMNELSEITPYLLDGLSSFGN